MIAITEHPLQALQEAYEQTQIEGKPRLVSFVKQINPYNPLELFYNGRNMFYGERFIWMDAARRHTLIGFNHLSVMTTEQDSERYRSIEEQWKRFMEQSVQKMNSTRQSTTITVHLRQWTRLYRSYRMKCVTSQLKAWKNLIHGQRKRMHQSLNWSI